MLKRVFNLNATSELPRRGVHQRGIRGIDREIAEKRRQLAEVEEQERVPEQTRIETPSENVNNEKYTIYGAVIPTRHGQTPSNAQGVTIGDTITKESITNLHNIGRRDLATIIKESGITITNENDFGGIHSRKKRTEMTINALAGGILKAINPKKGREEPYSPEDLERTPTGIKFNVDDRIGYKEGAGSIHEKLFKGEKTGAHQVLNHWLQNPLTDKHQHEIYGEAKIEPFVSVYKRTKEALQDALEDIKSGKHKVFMIGSHGTLKEPMVISMLYAAGVHGIRDINQLGGPIEKEENFVVLVRKNNETKRDEGLLRFRGYEFAFDLESFMDNTRDPYIAEVTERLKRGEFDRARPGRNSQNYAGQNPSASYDMDHEPTQDELAQMELRGERGYDAHPGEHNRSHEPKSRKDDLPADRYKRYAEEERRPIEKERKYAGKN